MTSFVRLKVGAGSLLMVAMLCLAGLALTSAITSDDLHVDQHLSLFRFGAATTVSMDLTQAAQAAVGLGALAMAAIVLFLRQRRWDAVRLVAVAGSAWVVALAVKDVFNRPRPPASLWLLRPDPTGSFPSGHTTTAVVIFLCACVLAWRLRRVRLVVIAIGLVYALAVGASRLYLGDHYPTDVLGSFLTVAATALLVWAITDLPGVRQLAARFLPLPELADTASSVDTVQISVR
ncbi:MAG TPA: phosphatase PAP2 family protein [Pseudonocardiaceae bacterium]|jgi:undecaprenyl-diphosphatase|nr:phosphatase PAP2 family protein [Pseudonocardiaceae bacterium]